MTRWSGARAYYLLSMDVPQAGQTDNPDQKVARELVEKTVRMSVCLKLMHGFSASIFDGDTLGMLWRKNIGSDAREGTYAAYLRSFTRPV